MILKILSKIFGNKYEKDLKSLAPILALVKQEERKLSSLSMENLRQQTFDMKKHLEDKVSSQRKKAVQLSQQAEAEKNISGKQEIYEKIDKVNTEIKDILEKQLDEILPQAFAVIRETARRFCENETLTVRATPHDISLAHSSKYVEIQGDKAVWKNSWAVAGKDTLWNMVHYDVQVIGGIVLHQGKIAEMATGEGKTLMSTLPIYLNALKGHVHVVTVNDYLARRDAQWKRPIFEIHGMTVDCIENHPPGSLGRKQAYAADITYGTNNEFGFDYLRDNMSHQIDGLVQSKLNYAIIDEVDSVLIDDARTPLIISGQVDENKSHHKQYLSLRPQVEQLILLQKSMVASCIIDIRKLLKAGDFKAAGFKMLQAHRGLPKNKSLIKLLSETGNKERLQKTEGTYLQDNAKRMPEVDKDLYFVIDEKQNSIDLTEKGISSISTQEDKDFFVLPDTSYEVGAIEKSDLSEAEKLEKKTQLFDDLNQKTQRIHIINQLLRAYTLFEKDSEYVVMDKKVKIVDEQTGRIMDGRRYSDGLHQAIEAKENVVIEASSQTLATVTLQNYFRMYDKLAGMTGTAETEAREFWEIYKMDVVVIPTHKPVIRDDRNDLVYKSVREKIGAIIREIESLRKAGRPVLVGTTSVETSELISKTLDMRRIPHNVLNAKLHRKEADIIAKAGQKGVVTIATNMAGRGTDIKLSPEVIEVGGLAIIGTERHDSRRVDRQLRGRAGRQGDVGSSQFFVSLEDNLMRIFGQGRMARVMDRIGLKDGEVIQHSLISRSIERAQKKVEENNFAMRKRLLEYDDVMNSQREIIYKKRRHALYGQRLQIDIANMFADTVEVFLQEYQSTKNYESLELNLHTTFGYVPDIDRQKLDGQPLSLVMPLFDTIWARQQQQKEQVKSQILEFLAKKEIERQDAKYLLFPFTDGTKVFYTHIAYSENLDLEGMMEEVEKKAVLSHIDTTWKEHLKDMDDLRQSVQGAVYEQKDPLLLYKIDALELFRSMLTHLDKEITTFLSRLKFPMHVEILQEKKSVQEDDKVKGYTESRSRDKERLKRKELKTMPAQSQKMARNQKVSIQHAGTGETRTLKYKNALALLEDQNWTLINEESEKA